MSTMTNEAREVLLNSIKYRKSTVDPERVWQILEAHRSSTGTGYSISVHQAITAAEIEADR